MNERDVVTGPEFVAFCDRLRKRAMAADGDLAEAQRHIRSVSGHQWIQTARDELDWLLLDLAKRQP